MTAVSGSSLERIATCPASAVLPQVRGTSESAERGTALHAFLADVGKLGREEALARVAVPEYREACEAIDLTELPPLSQLAAEVAYSYDYDTGAAVELGRDLGREYPELGPTEIPLTLDVVGLQVDVGGVLIMDWKTGHGRLIIAHRNWQLRLGALAAARAYGRSTATVALVRVLESPPHLFDVARFDELDLDTIELEVRDVMRRVAHARELLERGLQPVLEVGAHCRCCPAFTACPATTALIRQATAAPEIVDVRSLLTPDNAAEAYRRVKAVKLVLDRVYQALYAYAQTEGPIDLGDGLVFGPRKTERERVDGRVAREVLLQLHGQEIADAACEWDASKKSIEDALRAVAQKSGEKITHLQRAALDAIRQAGGIERNVSVKCEEHRPKARQRVEAAAAEGYLPAAAGENVEFR